MPTRAVLLLVAVAVVWPGLGAGPLPEPSASPEKPAPPERPEAESALAQRARSMQPGTWAELATEGLVPALRTSPPPSRGLDIMGWTDDACWDGRTRQFVYMGLRQTRRLIAYSERTNAWRDVPFAGTENAPHFENRFGHIYGNNAFDPERSRFVHLAHGGFALTGGEDRPATISLLDLRKGTWTRLPAGPPLSMTGNIEWFSARGGAVVLLGGGKLHFFDEARNAWESLGTIPVQGHHSLARHNPYRAEILFAGGNDTRRHVVRLDSAGKWERLPDAPVDLGVRHDKLVVDPVTGRYLILAATDRRLYEFETRTNEFRLVDDFSTTPWPFPRYDMPVVASVPEHGVTMWVASRVWLYRHADPRIDPKSTPTPRPKDE